MRKSFSIETVVVVLAALALLVAVFAPSAARTAFASENSSEEVKNSSEEVKWLPEPQPDPVQVAAEAQAQAIVNEGTKIENRSVGGTKSAADGLYLATEVNGVAFQAAPGSTLTETRVTTLDTDPKKSPAAMACVNNAAEANGLVPGPVIDIYVQKKGADKLQDGSFTSMGTVALGLPANFTGGTAYNVVVVAPGGNTEVLPATLSADGKSVSVDLTQLSDTAKAAKQLTVSICKAK